MAQVFVFGYMTTDLQLKRSQKQTPYVCFDLAEHIGFEGGQRAIYYQVWTWGEDALRLIRLKIKKGSMIRISGSQELVGCTNQNGNVKTKRLKVYSDSCGFLPDWQSKDQKLSLPDCQEIVVPANSLPPSEILDSERETLPERLRLQLIERNHIKFFKRKLRA